MTETVANAWAIRLVDFAPRLRAFIGRRVRCAATADDLTQDTLAKAWQRRADLRDATRMEAWLFRMARNALVDHWRRRPLASLQSEPAQAEENDLEISRCVARAARCYLETLPREHGDAVRLAEEEGCTHAEVAQRLGISLTAAKSRIRRGKQLVRARLEECCRFEFDRFGRVVDCQLRRPCCGRME